MYFWSLFLRTHSLSRAEPSYSAGDSRSFLTTSSNELGTTGAACMSGLPQFGLPRFFAIEIRTVQNRRSDSAQKAASAVRTRASRPTRKQTLFHTPARDSWRAISLRRGSPRLPASALPKPTFRTGDAGARNAIARIRIILKRKQPHSLSDRVCGRPPPSEFRNGTQPGW
jgi:hypothetical protein